MLMILMLYQLKQYQYYNSKYNYYSITPAFALSPLSHQGGTSHIASDRWQVANVKWHSNFRSKLKVARHSVHKMSSSGVDVVIVVLSNLLTIISVTGVIKRTLEENVRQTCPNTLKIHELKI